MLVTLATAVIGVSAAWCIERTTLPLRRFWAVLIVLPAAVPDFIVGYAWHSIVPSLTGLRGATIVMSLALLPAGVPAGGGCASAGRPVARGDGALARLRAVDDVSPGDAARRSVRRCSAAASLVMLALLAEFGAFEILRFQTFTTEVFTEFRVDQSAGRARWLWCWWRSGSSCCAAKGSSPDAGASAAAAPAAARPAGRRRLGKSKIPALLGFTALVGLSLGVPIGTLVYWLASSQHSTLPAARDPALRHVRHREICSGSSRCRDRGRAPGRVARPTCGGSRPLKVLERSTLLIQSIPGVVVALTLVFFSVRYAFSLYQTSALAGARVRDCSSFRSRSSAFADRPRRRRLGWRRWADRSDAGRSRCCCG